MTRKHNDQMLDPGPLKQNTVPCTFNPTVPMANGQAETGGYSAAQRPVRLLYMIANNKRSGLKQDGQ